MKNILIYIGIILLLFITPTTAPFLEIRQVGTTSSFLLIMVLLYEVLIRKYTLKIPNIKYEIHVIVICVFFIIFKIIDNNIEVLRTTFFFIVVPMLISILLNIQASTVKSRIKILVITFYFIECLLAIYEKISGQNIFPYNFGEDNMYTEIQSWEFRSNSLLGHPLTNALGVSIILGFILVSDFKVLFKIICTIIGFIAILCFNARGATIIWGLLILLYIYTLYIRPKQNVLYKWVILVLFCLPAIYGVYYLLYFTSLGGRLTNQNKLLDVSAKSRIDVFRAFDYLMGYDFWLGNPSNYFKIMRYLGAAGVENSYIVILIQYGIIFGIPLIVALFLFVRKYLVKYKRIQIIIIISSFIIVGSLNNALAGSTPWILFILCANCFHYNKTLKTTHKDLRSQYHITTQRNN